MHLLALGGHAVVEKEEVRAVLGLRVETLRLPCDDRQHRADWHRYGRASEVRPAGFLGERDFLQKKLDFLSYCVILPNNKDLKC